MAVHSHLPVLPGTLPTGDAHTATGRAHPGVAPAFDTTAEGRLALAYGTPRGPVDGAWWPRSADLSAEIGPMVAAVSDAYAGRVVRLVYDRTVWLPVPRRLPYREGYVKSGWFAMTDPHQLTLVMLNGTRVVLLVIPPSLPADQAMWALQRAVEPHNNLGPSEILRQAPSAVLDDELQRWFGEGGQASQPAPRRRAPAPRGWPPRAVGVCVMRDVPPQARASEL